MKTYVKAVLIVLAAAGLSASEFTVAAEGKNPVSGPRAEEPGHPGAPAEWHEFQAFKLEKLHKALKLNPTQEAAWNEWSGKMKAEHTGWKERHKEFEAMESLPVPERMEKMLGFAKDHVTKLEGRLAATKTFYSTLSADQRKTFDKEYTFGPQFHKKCRM